MNLLTRNDLKNEKSMTCYFLLGNGLLKIIGEIYHQQNYEMLLIDSFSVK